MNPPRIVFTTTCKGRVEHLAETLPRSIADNADYPNCKFVVLDYCDPGPLRKYLWENHRQDMRSGKLAVYHFFGNWIFGNPALNSYSSPLDSHDLEATLSNRIQTPDVPFHMAHAKNTATRCAILEGADVVVTMDADNYGAPGFATYIADNLKLGGFLCPNFPLIHAMPHGPDRPARGYAGRLAIRAHDFIKMGGYHETFDTWRGEDMDMLFRLRRAGYMEQHIDNRWLNAIRHNAEMRFKEYPHAKIWEEPDVSGMYLQTLAEQTETVVNNGKFGVGTVYKNFKPEPITIAPVPTRIFGIGMHRTATSSLSKAFTILGFDSFHFNTGNEARMIWEEMNISGRSNTLEKWYALCDLPIPLLYKKLDEAYPGSKFILTVRDEKAWLNSVRRLWDARFNPDRWTWDVYPFTHRIHRALYGRQDFDAPTMLARYRKHNADVKEYFKDRPDDLLVMDMDEKSQWKSGWNWLCNFLDVPVPEVSYPFANPSPNLGDVSVVDDVLPNDVTFRDYCDWVGPAKTIVEWGMFVPTNEYTQGLLRDWEIVDERVPLPRDTWIEEGSFGSGIMRDVAYNGMAATPLPTYRRLIVVPRVRTGTTAQTITTNWPWIFAEATRAPKEFLKRHLYADRRNWRKVSAIALTVLVIAFLLFVLWRGIGK